jgi:hypothetical protein
VRLGQRGAPLFGSLRGLGGTNDGAFVGNSYVKRLCGLTIKPIANLTHGVHFAFHRSGNSCFSYAIKLLIACNAFEHSFS